MNKFLDQDFLLYTSTAQKLYHNYAEQMPILIIIAILIPRRLQKI